MPDFVDYYSVLGAAPDAAVDQLRDAHRAAALAWHSDHWAHRSESQRVRAEEMMKRINTAWETLSVPRRRREYDLAWRSNNPRWCQAQNARPPAEESDIAADAKSDWPPPALAEKSALLGFSLSAIVAGVAAGVALPQLPPCASRVTAGGQFWGMVAAALVLWIALRAVRARRCREFRTLAASALMAAAITTLGIAALVGNKLSGGAHEHPTLVWVVAMGALIAGAVLAAGWTNSRKAVNGVRSWIPQLRNVGRESNRSAEVVAGSSEVEAPTGRGGASPDSVAAAHRDTAHARHS